MNGNYYNNFTENSSELPTYYQNNNETYIDNILKLNKGKKVKIYLTIPNQKEYTFEGIIESSGKDHIILSNPSNGSWQLIPIMYLDYIAFEEPIFF